MKEIPVHAEPSETAAETAAGYLRSHDIPARVASGSTIAAGIFSLGPGGWKVLVPEEHEDEAYRLLGTRKPEHRMREGSDSGRDVYGIGSLVLVFVGLALLFLLAALLVLRQT